MRCGLKLCKSVAAVILCRQTLLLNDFDSIHNNRYKECFGTSIIDLLDGGYNLPVLDLVA